jgi:isopentenyldiphosphate isomerase
MASFYNDVKDGYSSDGSIDSEICAITSGNYEEYLQQLTNEIDKINIEDNSSDGSSDISEQRLETSAAQTPNDQIIQNMKKLEIQHKIRQERVNEYKEKKKVHPKGKPGPLQLPDIPIPIKSGNEADADELIDINSFLHDILEYWLYIVKNKFLEHENFQKDLKDIIFNFVLFYQQNYYTTITDHAKVNFININYGDRLDDDDDDKNRPLIILMPNNILKEELKGEHGVNIGINDNNYNIPETIVDGNLQENIYTIFKHFIKISSEELKKHGKKITNLDTLEKEIDAMYRVRSDVVKKLNNNQEVRDNMNKNKRGLDEIFDTIQEKCKRPKRSGGKKKRKTKKLKKKAKTKKSKMKKIKRKTMKKKKSKKHKR